SAVCAAVPGHATNIRVDCVRTAASPLLRSINVAKCILSARARCSMVPLQRWEERMNATEKNIASARGEALAAHLMASAALQAVLMVLPNPLDALSRISAYLNDTLNASAPAKPDAQFDELNTQMREYARFQIEQTLQHIEHMLRNPPRKEPT